MPYVLKSKRVYVQAPDEHCELQLFSIRDFPDHATFREKGAKLACADKLGVFLSLTLCNKAIFGPLKRIKYDGLEECVTVEKCTDYPLFLAINHLMMLVRLTF